MISFRRQTDLPEVEPGFPINVERLSVATDTDQILNNVTVSVKSGDYAAIIGPSGSGKTTLASYILGLSIGNQPPVSGRVRYGDTSIYDYSENIRTQLRGKHFGYVPQSPKLIEGMSAIDNVLQPSRMSGRKVSEDVIVQVVGVMGVGRRMRTLAGSLSGGEQQRIAIVRALAHNPSVLVLDEPTANLNHELKAETNELLNGLAQELGKTVLVITHEQTSAERLIELDSGVLVGDRTIVLDEQVMNGQKLHNEGSGNDVELIFKDFKPVLTGGWHA